MRWLPLLLLTLALPAVPLRAEPRLTEKMPEASLAEVLDRLSAFYGRRMSAAPGAGQGHRVTLQWRSATLGAVVRELAQKFQVTPVTGADGSIRFHPGEPPQRGITRTAAGLSVTLMEASRHERRAKTEGAGTTESAQSVRLRVTVRSEDGEPNRILAIRELRATDEGGRELRLVEDEVGDRGPSSSTVDFPDEIPLSAEYALPDASARVIRQIEGEVVVSRSVQNHRIEIPWARRLGHQASAGTLQLTLSDARHEQGMFHGRATLAVPRDAAIQSDWANGRPDARPFLRDREGRLHPVRIASAWPILEPDGTTTLEFDLAPTAVSAEPLAVVWDVTVRSAESSVVPFRFTNVPLPRMEGAPATGTPLTARGGILILTLRGARPGAEVSIGLSRKVKKGWGAVRWSTLRLDTAARVRLDHVAPGSYRIVAQQARAVGSGKRSYRQRDPKPIEVTANGLVRGDLVREP